MKRFQNCVVWAVSVTTFGSGLINLYSVMSPGLPERIQVLRRLFPMEFLHLARFLTLLIGFALVISSLHLRRRKTRAFRVVFLLACLSVAFHLTKGLDYAEAGFSLGLLMLLILSRRSFDVASRSIPTLRAAATQTAMAAGAALVYGTGGFWLLESRHFGVTSTPGEAARRAIQILLFLPGQALTPRSSYAHWFVDSLYLVSAAFPVYMLFSIFRPVVYRFSTLPLERAKAEAIVRRHSTTTQDFFKIWPDKSFFFSDSGDSFLAYRVSNSFAVVLGDPVGPPEELCEIIERFCRFCKMNDWGVAFHQATSSALGVYRQLGFRKLKVGDDAIVDLKSFTLIGKAHKDVRTKFNQLEKDGIHAVHYPPPVSVEVLNDMKEVSDQWLQIPGRHERGFTLGQFDPHYVGHTHVLAARDSQGQMLAFLNLVPSFKKGETTVDLMRRRATAPNGVMDYLFGKLFLQLKEEGYERFNLGLAAMAGFQADEHAALGERMIHRAFQHMNFLFSFSGLGAYKAKFATWWEPRYVIYHSLRDLPRMAIALGKVSAIES